MDVEAVLITNMLSKLHYKNSKVWKRSYGPWARIPTLYENMNYNSLNALFFWCGRSNGKYLISAHFSNSTVCWLQMWVSHFWQHIRIKWMENFSSITCNWAVSTKSTCWDDWFSRIKRNNCNIYKETRSRWTYTNEVQFGIWNHKKIWKKIATICFAMFLL